MNFKGIMKKGSLVAALSLGLTAFAAPAAHADTNGKESSQKLVNALKALNLDHVDYLYSYLQKTSLTDQEQAQINANAARVSEILSDAKDVMSLKNEQKVEMLRLFLDSAKLAHLQVSLVDESGKSLDLLNYTISKDNNLLIQLKDLDGKLLATINPTREMVKAANFKNLVNSLKVAMEAKRELNETGHFVPMTNAELPNTASNEQTYMLIGGLIVLLGAAALVTAVRLVRKTEQA
ncbi:LPXTG cell wall anchor domain-containing protein [Bacillus mycoides]|uniref:LPXTG cell wall anchor domain-containing protein n=1 Tax=Bacillus mycoides TaxID=1405 RepID=UPI0028534A50|nr:LPXTG cell wall anchor domain-containing protein [Bacillus mycoides]MDR4899898.1 LPXTG cell wall anchor domain-containing protein [Bacillus mycoides]MED1087446.1 LPXTG cell wall anchor domain-containing protein [Bacillus mycoides]